MSESRRIVRVNLQGVQVGRPQASFIHWIHVADLEIRLAIL